MSSPAGSGDLVHVGPEAVVAASEAEFGCFLFEFDRRVDFAYLAPGDTHLFCRRRSGSRSFRSSRRADPSSRGRRGSRPPRALRRRRPRSRGHRRCRSVVHSCRGAGGRARAGRCRSLCRSILADVRQDHQRDRCEGDDHDHDEIEQPESVCDPAVDVAAHVGLVVRDEQDRYVGQRQRDH